MMLRWLPMLLTAGALGCADGTADLGGPADAARDAGAPPPDAAATADAGAALDAGAPPRSGRCGGRDFVAYSFDAPHLSGVTPLGEQVLLHTFAVRPEPEPGWTTYPTAHLGAEANAFMVRERHCEGRACRYRWELAIVAPARTWSWSTAGEGFAPSITALFGADAALVVRRLGAGRYQTVEVGPSGVLAEYPEGLSLQSTARVDGWRFAHWLEPDASQPSLAFVRGDEVRVLEYARTPNTFGAVAHGGWGVLLEDGLRIVGPESTREIPLPGPPPPQASLRGLTADVVGVFDADGPVWAVRLTDGAVAAFPPAPTRRGVQSTASPSGRWVVFGDEGWPRYRLRADAPELRVEVLDPDDLFPEGGGPFEASYCSQAVQIDDEGRLGYSIRRPGASGWYRQNDDGTPELVGRPLYEALTPNVIRRGDTDLVYAVSGRNTFCEQVRSWDEPAPEDAIPLERVLVVAPDGQERLLPEESRVIGLDPAGECLVWARPTGPDATELVISDLVTGEDRVPDGLGSAWAADPTYFQVP